jgi:hypothetical protein
MGMLYEYDSLEQDIINRSAKQLSDAIDFEVLSNMLVSCGWTKYQVAKHIDNQHAIDIREWVRENCQGEVKSHSDKWLFEDPKDATLFMLRWS